jgi:hypothetical protein
MLKYHIFIAELLQIEHLYTMMEGNSMHRPILHISMLFIVVCRIRQCTELHLMTVHALTNCIIIKHHCKQQKNAM